MKRPNRKDYDLGMTNEAISYAWDLGEYADYLEEQLIQGQKLPIDIVMPCGGCEKQTSPCRTVNCQYEKINKA